MTRRVARCLPEMAASPFLRLLPEAIVSSMRDEDFALIPQTRPTLMPGGEVQLRLVFRRRATGACVVLTWWAGGLALDDELLGMLAAGMEQLDAAREARRGPG